MTKSPAVDEISVERTSSVSPGAVAAVPVCNESERIAACLRALTDQIGLLPGSYGILLLLNNCTDDTPSVVAETIASFGEAAPWSIRVLEVSDAAASAGWARRQAMEAASRWLAEDGIGHGVLLTTDADSRVPPDWVARSLAGIAAGVDAVAGRVVLDDEDAGLLPASLHVRGRLEARYEALLTEIGARLDPEPGNPWPCHWTCSGASLAVRRQAYETVGGMPPLPSGEDRAFVAALRHHEFTVRQDPDLVVTTSARLEGRAPGGAADTMRRRCEHPDSACDDRLERLDRALGRILWRRWLRRAHADNRLDGGGLWKRALGVSGEGAEAAAALPSFAQAHAVIEAASPRLAYRPLPPSRLPAQIHLADLLVRALRRRPSAGGRADNAPFSFANAPERTKPLSR